MEVEGGGNRRRWREVEVEIEGGGDRRWRWREVEIEEG